MNPICKRKEISWDIRYVLGKKKFNLIPIAIGIKMCQFENARS